MASGGSHSTTVTETTAFFIRTAMTNSLWQTLNSSAAEISRSRRTERGLRRATTSLHFSSACCSGDQKSTASDVLAIDPDLKSGVFERGFEPLGDIARIAPA